MLWHNMFVRDKLFTHELIAISCFAQAAPFRFSNFIAEAIATLVKMGTQMTSNHYTFVRSIPIFNLKLNSGSL